MTRPRPSPGQPPPPPTRHPRQPDPHLLLQGPAALAQVLLLIRLFAEEVVLPGLQKGDTGEGVKRRRWEGVNRRVRGGAVEQGVAGQ